MRKPRFKLKHKSLKKVMEYEEIPEDKTRRQGFFTKVRSNDFISRLGDRGLAILYAIYIFVRRKDENR